MKKRPQPSGEHNEPRRHAAGGVRNRQGPRAPRLSTSKCAAQRGATMHRRIASRLFTSKSSGGKRSDDSARDEDLGMDDNEFTPREREGILRIPQMPSTDACPVCFSSDADEPMLTTACRHSLHTQCMQKWHHACRCERRPLTCPICRTVLETTGTVDANDQTHAALRSAYWMATEHVNPVDRPQEFRAYLDGYLRSVQEGRDFDWEAFRRAVEEFNQRPVRTSQAEQQQAGVSTPSRTTNPVLQWLMVQALGAVTD